MIVIGGLGDQRPSRAGIGDPGVIAKHDREPGSSGNANIRRQTASEGSPPDRLYIPIDVTSRHVAARLHLPGACCAQIDCP